MEFITNIDWWKTNSATIALSAAVFIQWVALQALFVHYHLFRKNLKKPRPDGIRFNTIERAIALQVEQMEKAYTKLAELTREVDILHDKVSKPVRYTQSPAARTGESIEVSYASMGELNLRKRIQEIRTEN